MYPVSQDFQEMIKKDKNNRLFEAKIKIEHSKGTLEIGDKELVHSALVYTESSQAGEEFTIGSTVASDISFNIMNKPEYEDIQFMGATVTCNIGLLVKEGMDAHFMQPSQPSKMPGFEEKWEHVPLGRFNIDDVNRQRNTIELKAIDNMINLDIPYSLSKLSYPATLYQIYVNICNVSDIQVGTTSFPNMNYVVNERPSEDLTLRDVLGYVAELSGTFAKCNRNGALELRWYRPTGITLEPSNRFDFKASDDVVQIKGIMASTEDTTYLTGSEDYAIDLTENPLLRGGHETVLPNIFNNVKDTVFTPYTSGWQGNPALQAGDIITQVDRDGKIYNTLVTKSTYKYRGRSNLEAKGLPEISKGYKGSTNRRIAEIRRKIDVEVGDKLTTLEQAQLNATELLANMLGGYIIEDKPNGILYIADNPDINKAMKVWKYGINGFGYSSTGKDGPFLTAITADGSIVAMLVSANIITANMVQTGILTSADGSSWFNLDTGEINIKNQLRFINGVLTLAGIDTGNKVFNTTPTTPYSLNDLWKVTGITGVDFRICTRARASGNYVASDWTNITNTKDYADLIKNLTTGTAISGGNLTIDREKIRINHGSGIYSQFDIHGAYKQYANGQGEYLNSIHVEYVDNFIRGSGTRTPYIYVDIPEVFRNRQSEVDIILIPGKMRWTAGYAATPERLRWLVEESESYIRHNLSQSNFNPSTGKPYIAVRSEVMELFYVAGAGGTWNDEYYYHGMDFVLMIVGR